MAVQLENYIRIKEKAATHKATLVAVSKTKPLADLQLLYDQGQIDFGENYVQELNEKESLFSKNAHWHFIGHLQSNKVKNIASFVHLIHGIDSYKLLTEVNKQAQKSGRVINCLLQVHIASEETKFGFDESEVEELMNNPELTALEHIQICGLMGMASFTEDKNQIKKEFSGLKKIFDNSRIMSLDPLAFNILSMGMTSDYEIALDCGSTMIRIGSALFGERTTK
ncbi:YggS family pyridoxal phosphate-dependent enzyme [soil metagenome]